MHTVFKQKLGLLLVMFTGFICGQLICPPIANFPLCFGMCIGATAYAVLDVVCERRLRKVAQ